MKPTGRALLAERERALKALCPRGERTSGYFGTLVERSTETNLRNSDTRLSYPIKWNPHGLDASVPEAVKRKPKGGSTLEHPWFTPHPEGGLPYTRPRPWTHDPVLLDKLDNLIREIRWETRDIPYRDFSDTRHLMRSNRPHKSSPQSSPPDKIPPPAVKELEVALFHLWMLQGYASDTSSPPAFSTKASMTQPKPPRVESGGSVRNQRRARVPADPPNSSVPATVRKREIDVSFYRRNSANCAQSRPRMRAVPPSRSIRSARKRLSKSRALGRNPPVASPPLWLFSLSLSLSETPCLPPGEAPLRQGRVPPLRSLV